MIIGRLTVVSVVPSNELPILSPELLVTTQHFERRARNLLRKHPDLRPALRDTLDDLSRDPFQPKLKLHPLAGNLSGVQAVSLTYTYRLTLLVRVTEQEIVLLDIGTHDEVYR